MPIEVKTEIKIFDQEEFHALDRRILGVVFDVHNEFGRFLDEQLYKAEIAARCQDLGIVPVEREVHIRVTHETFSKDYRMDLLFGGGLMLEAKATETIVPADRNQALNYLFLAGMNHGRLVNLRPERVEHEFVSTRLTPERRRQFTVVDKGWKETDEASAWLRQKVEALLHDWGAFLEVTLYRDALDHFVGGAKKVIQPIPVYSGERLLGKQLVHLLTADTTFSLTATTTGQATMAQHLLRFVVHTPLRRLHWINLNHHDIEFTTISK